MARISWQRAITLFFSGKVEVLEEYADREIRSVTFAIKIPAVVRFLRALRGQRTRIRFSRENVYTRDSGKCQYCGTRVARPEATYDHVMPRSKGGQTTWENIVIACLGCNQKKGGRTPEQAGMKLLSKPVRPKRLPDSFRMTFAWKKGMPEPWRNWLRDLVYWNGELDEG
jgi:5-methylcytosine-specific restriction endonuclease McrA